MKISKALISVSDKKGLDHNIKRIKRFKSRNYKHGWNLQLY